MHSTGLSVHYHMVVRSHQLAQYHMVVRSPPVSTVSHGGQITTSQHSITWWSDHHQSAQYHMVVRSHQLAQYHMVVRSPPVTTVSHGGQIIVHSISQHSTTWWSDHHRSAQYHMVVRSPPVSTVPHGGQLTSGQYSTNVVVRRKLGTRGKRRGSELSAEP